MLLPTFSWILGPLPVSSQLLSDICHNASQCPAKTPKQMWERMKKKVKEMPYGKITINYSGQCKTNFLWRTDTIVYTDDTIYISFNMFNRTIFIFVHLFFLNLIYLTLILVKNCGVWILFKAHPNPIKNFKIKYPGTYGIVLSSECSVHI